MGEERQGEQGDGEACGVGWGHGGGCGGWFLQFIYSILKYITKK